LYARFGFKEVSVGFSTRPPVRAGSDEVWDRAEGILAAAAEGAGLSLEIQPGAGAFYGPKLEFALKDRIGRLWQCGTIQLDLVLPERFGVQFTDASGARERPAMLHRALFGSLERFLGILLEHYQGALPAWLAPAQIVVAPVADAQRSYAEEVVARLQQQKIRAELDARSETLSKKIVDARALKIPLLAVAGRREVERRELTIRAADGSQRELDLEAAIGEIKRLCEPEA
jgi:threonyl-tRNA synthetase